MKLKSILPAAVLLAIAATLAIATELSQLSIIPPSPQHECNRATYCLAIDESEHITDEQYELLKNGARTFMEHVSAQAPGSQFLLYGFSTSASHILAPATGDLSYITTALTNYRRRDGRTILSAGLSACGASLKTAASPGVVVLLTTGGEAEPHTGQHAANALRWAGYSVVTIAVGLQHDDGSLDGVADSPALNIRVSGFHDLVGGLAGVANTMCGSLPAEAGICTGDCRTSAVCFAVDESGSIQNRDFRMQAATLAGLISVHAQVAPGGLYAAVGFADEAHVIQKLTFDAGEVMAAFLENGQRGGASSSGAGLLACKDILGSVPGPKTVVLVADGIDNKSPAGVETAPALKAAGITVVSVGVGANAAADLRQMASGTPGHELYTAVDDFATFSQAIGPILQHVCVAAANWKAPPPPAACATVFCATCGSLLECYVHSGNAVTDERACAGVLDRRAFCARRGWRRTKCGQDCIGEVHAVCYGGAEFGLFEDGPACRSRHADGSKLFPSFFAKYEACQLANGLTKNRCLVRKCNADTLGQVCYPQHL